MGPTRKSTNKNQKEKKSNGPLGDLLRDYRIKKKLGLLAVSKAVGCSIQFISNIEHGRAPLPWDRAEKFAQALGIPFKELHAANLVARSDFRTFIHTAGVKKKSSKTPPESADLIKNTAAILAFAAQDAHAQDLLQWDQSASEITRKKLYTTAKKIIQ